MARHTTLWLALSLVLVTALVTCGCTGTTMASAGDLKKFNSADEIKQYIKENSQKAQDAYYSTGVSGRMVERGVPVPVMGVQESAKGSADYGAGGVDYSQTNVQVAGVDEPDIVKNDNRYIYTLSGQKLVVVNAYPTKDAKIISETDIESTPKKMFVNGNRLVVFLTGSIDIDVVESSEAIVKRTGYPIRRMATATHAIIYDISNHAKPTVIKDYTIDGDYVDARMIGNTVYMLTREYVYPYDDEIVVPAVHEGQKVVVAPDVYYIDNPEREYVFTTVTAFDATSCVQKDAKTFLLGSGNILYVSQNAMYISYQKYHAIVSPMFGEPVIASAPEKAGRTTEPLRYLCRCSGRTSTV